MNWRRIFANAVARRIAYVLVALVLGWFGLTGEAHAQAGACPRPSDGGTCTQAEAWQACQTEIAIQIAQGGFYGDPSRHRCMLLTNDRYRHDRRSTSGWVHGSGDQIFHFVAECPPEWFDPETGACENPCTGKPPLSNVHAEGDSDQVCSEGCAYQCSGASMLATIDGVLRTVCAASAWTVTGAACSAGELPSPIPSVTDLDGDGTSDEYDLSPNNPGESGDGSGQDVSRACGGPGQPECLPDGSNEGSGRGNTSGGGGDCNTPPRSSGDAILAQIAFQTWATRCAIQGTANSGAGTGSGSGDGGEGVLDQLRAEAAGLDQSLGDGDAEAAWIEGPTTLDLDTGGLGIGGTCPAPPTVNGESIDPDGNLCMLVQIIGALVLVGAYVHAGYIIGRA